jgi:hypothetical protein
MFKKLKMLFVTCFVVSLILLPMNHGFAQTQNPPPTDSATLKWPISPDKWPLVSVNIKRQYDPVTKTYITLTREVREMRNSNFVPIGVDRQAFLACGPSSKTTSTYATITCTYLGAKQVKESFYSNGLTQTVTATWGKYKSSASSLVFHKFVSVSNNFSRINSNVNTLGSVAWKAGCNFCFACSNPNGSPQSVTQSGQFNVSWLSSGSLLSFTNTANAASNHFAGWASGQVTDNNYNSSVTVVYGRSYSTLKTLVVP